VTVNYATVQLSLKTLRKEIGLLDLVHIVGFEVITVMKSTTNLLGYNHLSFAFTLVVVAYKPMRQNIQDYQTVANNPCQHINAELLLVSRMDYAMRILPCSLVLDVLMMLSLPKCASSVKCTDDTKNC
jgi:hypothetical protein